MKIQPMNEERRELMKKYSIIIYVLALLALCSCTSLYRATYGVAVEERSAATIASDKNITLTIQEKFLGDDAIKALDISPFCYNGHVYLVGEYGTEKERGRALEIANKVAGVNSITPYLLPKKKKDTCGTTDNVEIAAKVSAKLIGDKDIWSTNIDVKVVQCNVVLLGIVGSKTEIDKAVAHARSVSGIRGVISYLKAVK
jgi:hyperosmotically inducible periplasmic protein